MTRLFAVTFAVICACFSITSSAMAEDMNYPSNPLEPVLSGTTAPANAVGKGILIPQVEPAHFTFECTLPAVVVQADVSGFAIGNCLQGTHIRRELKSAEYAGHYWDGGWVFGSYSGCGWVQQDFSSQAGTASEQLCNGNVSKGEASFAVADNDNTGDGHGCSWKPNSAGVYRCTDGTDTTMSQACTAYGNFRPWLSGQTPTDALRTIPANAPVKWRYVSKYSWTAGGDSMVMIRDNSVGGGTSSTSTGYGNWVFVKSTCLSGLPGLRYL